MFLAVPAVATNALSPATSDVVMKYLPDVTIESLPSTISAGVPSFTSPYTGIETNVLSSFPFLFNVTVTLASVFDKISIFALSTFNVPFVVESAFV